MKNYRIVYSDQNKKFKVQTRWIFFWWIDMEKSECKTYEACLDYLKFCQADDWKEVNK